MKLVKLTHANLKTPIFVDLDLVVAWYFSEGSKSTHVVASGGAMVPVSETVEHVARQKAEQSAAPEKLTKEKGKKNK